MSRGVRWRGSAVAAVLVSVALTGCGTPAPAPTPTPTGFATEDEAFAAAEATYRAYVDALNQVDLSDPETFEEVYAWTTGELNASDRKGLSAYHADGLTVSGSSVVRDVYLGRYSDSPREVLIDVCLDVSSIDLVGPDGESRVDPDRADVQQLQARLTDGSTPTGLAIAQISARDSGPSC